jgi:succinate-acetate transporter protein
MTILVLQNAMMSWVTDIETFDVWTRNSLFAFWIVLHVVLGIVKDKFKWSWLETAMQDDAGEVLLFWCVFSIFLLSFVFEEWLPETALGSLFCHLDRDRNNQLCIVNEKWEDVTTKLHFD